ncbi:MAG TPA: hypothetical protein VK487_02065 [Candidatus Bathyarchaeia archaeon]|nr:hypothetical protein [Candidatus Bathyarchaeia archaeon]
MTLITVAPSETTAIPALVVALFFGFLLPTALELRKPRDAGPRRIVESDGQEMIGFCLLSAIFPSHDSKGKPPFLEDIEPQEFEPAAKGSSFLSLPNVEF